MENQKSKSGIERLQDQMFDTIEQLKSGAIDVNTAKQVAEVGKVIVDSAKAELDYQKLVNNDEVTKSTSMFQYPQPRQLGE